MATRQELYKKAYGENAPQGLLYLLSIKDIKEKYKMERNNLTELQKAMLFHSAMSKKIIYHTNDGVVFQKNATELQR